jgi:DNA-binding MarR family transcriptional regulator
MDRIEPSSLGFLLFDAARLLRRRFERESRDVPMTAAQMEIVQRLKRNEGMSQAALARLLDIEPMTLSRHIDRMEAAGLVERRPDPNDRRARRLHTTEKARDLVEPMRAHAVAIYEEAQSGLAPEARDALVAGLVAIVANLSAAEAADDQQPERRGAAGA